MIAHLIAATHTEYEQCKPNKANEDITRTKHRNGYKESVDRATYAPHVIVSFSATYDPDDHTRSIITRRRRPRSPKTPHRSKSQNGTPRTASPRMTSRQELSSSSYGSYDTQERYANSGHTRRCVGSSSVRRAARTRTRQDSFLPSSPTTLRMKDSSPSIRVNCGEAVTNVVQFSTLTGKEFVLASSFGLNRWR